MRKRYNPSKLKERVDSRVSKSRKKIFRSAMDKVNKNHAKTLKKLAL